MKEIISIKDLNWSYGDEKILENIDMSIEKGKLYTVIGPNGSGKTTLFKIITKILEPYKNAVKINGAELSGFSHRDLAKQMSIVPQNTTIDFDFSVMDIVMMGRAPYIKRFESESEDDFNLAKEAMEMVDIWSLREKNINEISGGERQRVIIARAITQDTEVMLLDEPISHIDLRYQIELLDTIKKLNKEKNITIIAILHDLNLAAEYSDEILLLNRGKVYSKGNAETVLTEENIRNVYGVKVNIIKNPQTDKPHIIPIYSQFY